MSKDKMKWQTSAMQRYGNKYKRCSQQRMSSISSNVKPAHVGITATGLLHIGREGEKQERKGVSYMLSRDNMTTMVPICYANPGVLIKSLQNISLSLFPKHSTKCAFIPN